MITCAELSLEGKGQIKTQREDAHFIAFNSVRNMIGNLGFKLRCSLFIRT